MNLLRVVWVCGALLAPAALAQSVVKNGSFDEGSAEWENPGHLAPSGVSFDWQKDGGRTGSGALHVHADADVSKHGPWIWSQKIEPLPEAKAFKLTVWIKGKAVSDLAAVCIQAWAKDTDDMSGFATTQNASPLKGDFDWTKAETVLVPKEGTGSLIVMAFIAGTGEAWFDDITLEPTEIPKDVATGLPAAGVHDTARAGQPGLFMVRGATEYTANVDGAKPRFAMPLPLCNREQTPLSFRIVTTPEDRLNHVTLHADTTGGTVLEGELDPMADGEKIEVRWEALVAAGPRSFEGLPKSAVAIPAEWPQEARPWLGSTWCVGSDEARIREVGAKVRGDGKDVMGAIDRACEESQGIFRKAKGHVTSLTAVEALDHQGSCTSCANLVAALLRAAGIPARVLSGYPSWSGPLQTHYIVEAYVPGYGWYPIESTMGKNPWPPCGQIVVRVIPPEDEGNSAKMRFNAAGGVPYLSLTEYPKYDKSFAAMGTLNRKTACDHEAVVLRPLAGTPQEWKAMSEKASQRWRDWLAQAMMEGGPRELAAPPGANHAESPAGLLQ